ncbi:MerR family transcriptional regulator [Paenibacillus daejeonensis]|uniref:MerR family transcriptional regulator n=1 Tax=Paenibacillus daejeonensis TaxID=135193 RepID=UPI0003782CC1|nr:MerR family transcriptional regulator [Paenibacillus daejeonensis]
MQKSWKIGELSKLTGLTIRTLQYYDQIGLFQPSGDSNSKQRLYTEEDISRLQHVLSLKELGLSLDQIKLALVEDQVSLFEIISLHIKSLKDNIAVQMKLVHELESIVHLMDKQEPLTLEHYTNLLGAMRMKHAEERRTSWNVHLDRLGDYLGEDQPKHPTGGHSNE